MIPLIMLALSMAQKKQQQNAAETQQLANSMNAGSQAPTKCEFAEQLWKCWFVVKPTSRN